MGVIFEIIIGVVVTGAVVAFLYELIMGLKEHAFDEEE